MRDEFKNSENWNKRFLPHYNANNKFQMITYRLADSLPQEVLHKITDDTMLGAPHSDAGNNNLGAPHSDAGNNNLGAPHSDAGKTLKIRDYLRRKLIEDSLDKGFGSCLLKYPDVADKVVEAWQFHNHKKYKLISYIVMPNHVHVLIQTFPDYEIGKIVWSWKKFVSNYVFKSDHYKELLNNSLIGNLTISISSRAPENKKRFLKPASECGAPSLKLWQREYWDRFIRDENHFQKAIEYIHMNPVKAGLVSQASEWKHSSLNYN